MHVFAESRLAILQSLAEARKRAETLENELFSKIHTENAAFAQLAKSYEDSLTDFSNKLETISHSFVKLSGDVDSRLSEEVVKLENRMTDKHAEYLRELDNVKVASMETSAILNMRIDQVKAEFENKLSPIVERLDQLDKRIESVATQSALLVESLETRLCGLLEEKGAFTEDKLRGDIQAVESKLHKYIDSLHVQTSIACEGMQTQLLKCISSEVDLNVTASLKNVYRTLSENSVDLAQHKQVYDLYTQLVDMHLHTLDSQMATLLSAGLHHQWTLSSTDDEFTQSPLFKLTSSLSGCFFRFFPATNSLWLVWKPTHIAATSPPILVDLSLGAITLSGIMATRTDRLHGHWIWEAVFPRQETTDYQSHTTVVSVTVSLRQWLLDPTVQSRLRNHTLPLDSESRSNPFD